MVAMTRARRGNGFVAADGAADLAAEARRAAADMAAQVEALAIRFDAAAAARAARLILAAERRGGRVHVLGIGKPGHVARYLAASLSSTGTPAYFLDAADALHGTAGQVRRGDVVIAVSNSGRTPETKAAVTLLRTLGARIVGVSGRPRSWLAAHGDVFLDAGVAREGDALNLAPRASVLAETLVLSALSAALQAAKRLTPAQFRRWHPGGALGERRRRTARVRPPARTA